MIKNIDSYPKGRNNSIKTNCRVTVICDHCGLEWETQYSNYKNKKLPVDFCQSCKNRFGFSGMLNKKHSTTSRQIMSQKRSGKNNSFYNKSHSDVQKQKWSAQRKGKPCRNSPCPESERKLRSEISKRYWDNLTEEEKSARLANCDFSAMRKRLLSNGGKYSKLHNKVKQDMIRNGIINFQSEEFLGNFIFDEIDFKNKLIIEVNGDYWHANPETYNADEIIFYPKGPITAKSVWKKDAEKIQFANTLGYKVIVVWEKEVKCDQHILKIKKEII